VTDTGVLVIIVSADDGRWLPECLRSLAASSDTHFRVLLVDNACSDGTVAIARTSALSKQLTVVHMPKRCGFAEANNVGLQWAMARGFRYVFLLNPDTRAHPEALVSLRRFLDGNPEYGIAGSRQIDYVAADWETPNDWTRETLAHAESLGQRPKRVGTWTIVEHNYVQGAALMLRASLLPVLGFLDPVYGSFYEETDFCRRCLLANRKVALLLDSAVKHYGGGNWKASPAAHLARDVLFLRNQLLYFLSAEEGVASTLVAALRLMVQQVRGLQRGEHNTRLPFWGYPKVLTGFVARAQYLPTMQRRNAALRGGRAVAVGDYAIGAPANVPLPTVPNHDVASA
jgi:GT2 family glycosyltransferase